MILTELWHIDHWYEGLVPSIVCILIVFCVLAFIAFILSILNKIKALDVKEKVVMSDGTEVDDDMMAAILIATIDYQKEIKEDVKVISCQREE